MDAKSIAPNVAVMWDEFITKKDDPLYVRNVLSGLSGIMLIFTAAFFICALVCASIDNAGFNVVLTGLLLCVWEVGTIWLMKRAPQEISLGFLIGVTIVMNMVTIMTAIYWGQLANCDSDYDGDYDQYSCNNKAAIRGVAAFASIIWVLQLPFLYVVIDRRGALMREATYDDGHLDYNDPKFEGWRHEEDHFGAGGGSMGAGYVEGSSNEL